MRGRSATDVLHSTEQDSKHIEHPCKMSLFITRIQNLMGLKPNPLDLSSFSALTLLVGVI